MGINLRSGYFLLILSTCYMFWTQNLLFGLISLKKWSIVQVTPVMITCISWYQVPTQTFK